jgi:ATP-dependent helicase/nuclease subunit B
LIKVPSHLEAVIEAGGTVVTPTRQRAYALRLAHAAAQLAHGRRVWASPDVLPLEGWLTREFERAAACARGGGLPPRLLRPAEEWLLWRECAAAATRDLDLVNPVELAEGLLGARRLAGEFGIDLAALRADRPSETALLLEVARAVAERSLVLGACSLDEVLRVCGALGDGRPVALCGFLTASPRLGEVIAGRQGRGWDTRWCEPADDAATPEVVQAADELEELDRIAAWCRERLATDPAGRLLVVLPGGAGRTARLAALIRQALDVPGAYGGSDAGLAGIEGGEPLARHPAVLQALTALALLAGQSLPLETVLEWVRSPFWVEPAEGRARLDLWLREQAPPALERHTLLQRLTAAPLRAAGALASRIREAAGVLAAPSSSPREWSERFQAALDALGWPGATGLDSPAQQTLLRVRELLDEYGQLAPVVGRLECAPAFERLRELAARTAYRPADEDVQVTVTTALADPVARYDGIWVAGLRHDALPQPPAPDPFIPLHAQLAAGSPAASAAGRLREAQALLAAWRAATPRLVLSVPLRAEDVVLLPSPLLAPWCRGGPRPLAPLAWLPERVHRTDQLEAWRDGGVPWDAAVPLPSGTRSLELQNACPFRAYAELRLGCEPLGANEPGVPADLRGRLLHAALQALWRELGGSSGLNALSPERLDERIGECIEAAARALLVGQSAPPSAAALARERRRAVRLIRALCDLERSRPAFTVRATERAAHLTLAGLRLDVRIDRIDALEGGALAILDYKSGNPVRAEWYAERPSHPQLLAYLAAVGEAVRALATVHLTARHIGFHGIAAQADLVPGLEVARPMGEGGDAWRGRLAAWQALLERLAGAFGQGEAAVDPKPGACDYCHLGALCRIGERPESPATPPSDPGVPE